MPTSPEAIERALQSRVDQGFERQVTDPETLALVARILAKSRAAS
jgi:hypothetical protein